MPKFEHDLYLFYKAEPSFTLKIKNFIKERGIELTIALVGIFIGIATVAVSYKVGKHQEILQASRMTDSYFNGIVDLFVKSSEENQKINLLMIARTEAILDDLQRLRKPDKIANIVTFISNLKPKLFYKDLNPESPREKYIYLGHLDISETTLRDLNLENARLNETNLRMCDFTNSNLQFAQLRKANLEKSNLDSANLNHSNLQGANLKDASINRTTFENANLENAIWVDGIRCKRGSIGHCIH